MHAGTSCNIFHCFCDTLFNIENEACGGPPQLVGVYCKPDSAAINFGIIKSGKRYLFGTEVDNLKNFDQIEWRNDLFEICDGRTKMKRANAMSQPNTIRIS
jgi:hypothetical protein